MLIIDEPSYIRATTMAEFDEDNCDEFGVNSQNFTSILEPRDNFAISATVDNKENVDFYLLVCTMKMYIYKKALTCK